MQPNWLTRANSWRRRCSTSVSKGGAHLRHEKDGQFWRWVGTHWTPIDDKALQRLILETAKTLPVKTRTKSLVHEAFAFLTIQQASENDLLHIHDEPPPVINVANGELFSGRGNIKAGQAGRDCPVPGVA
jgi:hypothetical protein